MSSKLSNLNQSHSEKNARRNLYKKHKDLKKKALKRMSLEEKKLWRKLDNKGKEQTGSLDCQAFNVGDFDIRQILKAVKTFSDLADSGVNRMLFDFEGFLSLWTNFCSTKNIFGWISGIHLFYRAHHSESITLKVIRMIIEALVPPKVEEQTFWYYSGPDSIENRLTTLDCQAMFELPAVEDGLKAFKDVMEDWGKYKESDLAKNLANAVNVAVTFGFFPEMESNELKLGTYTIMKTKSWDLQKDTLSFGEMSIKTLFFFIERGYAAFKHQDISMLLYCSDQMKELDEEYSLLVSALPLLECGKLESLKNYNLSIRDEYDFDKRLDTLYRKITGMAKTEKHPQSRTILTNKMVILSKLRTQLILCQKQSCIRDKPFGILIHGGSGVGKTAVNGILLKLLADANGFDSSKEAMVTLNEADKYMSEYDATHTAVTLDDFCNMKPEHYDGSPCEQIITFLNNVPKAAIKAEAELKGNVMIQPKFVSVTTNVKHLHAGTFSSEPASILRRFEVVLDVKLRPNFIDPLTQSLDKRKMIPGIFMPDAWQIDIQYVSIVRKEGDKTDGYEFIMIKKDASIFDVVNFMIAKSQEHFTSQKAFVATMEDMYKMETCEHFFPKKECPHCKCTEKLDSQMLFDPLGDFRDCDPSLVKQVRDSINNNVNSSPNMVESLADWYIERKLTQAVKFVSIRATTFVDLLGEKQNWIIGGLLGGATGIALYHAIKFAMKMQMQGSEISTPVLFDDDTVNPWKKVKNIEIPITMKASTTAWSDLYSKVTKHCGFIDIYDLDKSARRSCMIMPICNNYWLMPGHMVKDSEEYIIEVQTTPKDTLGKNPTQIIGKEIWYRIPKTDFILICLTSGGDVPDFSEFLPKDLTHIDGLAVKSVLKDRDGDTTEFDFRIGRQKRIEAKCGAYNGIDYYFPENTRPGMCMMPLIPRKSGATILGFHLAGRNGAPYGAAGLITKETLDNAIVELRKQHVLESHSAGTMVTEKFGIDFRVVEDAHEKSPVHFLQEEDGVQPVGQVYGQHSIGMRHFNSNVRTSPISPLVEEVMDLPNKHGKPKCMNSWKHWQRDLDQMSKPRGMFRPKQMQHARKDMKEMVLKILEEQEGLTELIHPYSLDAVLAGVDGVNSVDRVDLSTSMGWPINKQKKNFITESDRKVKGISCPLDVDPMFIEEMERMEEVLASGKRVHTIFRANLKDEPTKLTKDKVRVFAGSEFTFSCVVRKYFLSLIRVIQKNWLKFECAVGVVAQSEDWTKLADHLIKFGNERMVAGDYKAFDKSASPEIMMAAFDILVYMAQLAGYSDCQLSIMRGVATEICYPIYEYNGVYVNILGSNPSGHPLTVIINNISNSLYMRYSYYVLHENEKDVPLFHEVISLMCYGDDNAMGVHENEKKFNHTTVSKVLKDVGITYTMADKETESVPFIPFSEVNFLKRGFRWDDELQNWIAPIEELSIQKSLHNQMKNKGSTVLPEQIAADSIFNANAEYWRHGKEIFNVRHAQLKEIMERADLKPFIGDLPDHAEMVQRYRGMKTRKSIYDEPNTARFE